MQKIITISKEELAELPAEEYDSKIEIVEDAYALQKAITILRKNKVLGFDTETRPSFRKGESHNVSLIQFATPEITYLIRINKIGFTKDIIEILEDSSIKKIGCSIHDDFHNLRKLEDFLPENFIDLQIYSNDFLIKDCSLSKMNAIIFGKRISKHQRLSNWEAEELSESQKNYAALDAMACLNIYNYLNTGKFKPEKSKYLKDITEESEDVSIKE